MNRPDKPLAPARRTRPGTPVSSDYDDEEVARGQAAAVLGALGRMQLKLDVLAREQSEALARLEERIDALDRRLSMPAPVPTVDPHLGPLHDL